MEYLHNTLYLNHTVILYALLMDCMNRESSICCVHPHNYNF